ncbi:MAG: competence/damage-inducible protein A [Candidatus Tectimicrobiota bacterium]
MAQEPQVEIFSLGTELVLGRIQDTNSFWMAQELVALGALVRRITVLPDDLDLILEAWTGALQRRADVVLMSGGLGPTPDDLTVAALARLMETELRVDEATLDIYVQRRNLSGRGELTPALRRMATVPAGAQVYQNPAGWAPCVSVTRETTTFFALPGPPPEMQAVFTMHLVPFFRRLYPANAASLRVAVDMYESELAPLFAQVRERYPSTYLKGYIALAGRDAAFGLPLDIIARSTAETPAEVILQQAVAYLSTLVASKGCTLRNL